LPDSVAQQTPLPDTSSSSGSTSELFSDSPDSIDNLIRSRELDEEANMPPRPARPAPQPVLVDNRIIEAFKSLSMSNIPYNLLPKFNGERGGPSIDEIFEKLNTLGTAYRWTDEDCAQIFRLCLEGDAAAIYDQLPTAVKSNWIRLVEEFKKDL
jgi:hypothetical protein